MYLLQIRVNNITSYRKYCIYIFVELLSKAERRFEGSWQLRLHKSLIGLALTWKVRYV